MGELVVGRPAPQQLFTVSAPLELTSALSMTFRAGGVRAARINAQSDEGIPFERWFVDAYRTLDAGLRHDLELLLGFSGRLLYYAEELLFSFDALSPDRIDASYDDYYSHLQALPADAFQRMAADAIVRIYQDRGVNGSPPETDDPADWRLFVWPGVTRASVDEAAALLTSPQLLKARTLALIDGFWRQCYQPEYERELPELQRAARYAEALEHPSVEITFAQLTGQQLPTDILPALRTIERVTYCPSLHLGSFTQYILYPPDLILYFDRQAVMRGRRTVARMRRPAGESLDVGQVLQGLRALADPSRMKIIDMLREQELYAQEIVQRLRISQSAVSRHLSTLEDAHLVTVRPSNGMKYYAINRAHLRSVAGFLESQADVAHPED
jgi:DNA-binding transcriptional ArsR family regulator